MPELITAILTMLLAFENGARPAYERQSFAYSFDFYDEGVKIAEILKRIDYPLPCDFEELASRVGAIAAKMHAEAGEPVLCHNDFYGPNFLVRGDEMRLIDWEYAAMGDPACDIGNFVAQGSGYTVEQTLAILPLYYGREASDVEKRHCLAAVGLVGWYWYIWAMYKEAMGNPVGEWLLFGTGCKALHQGRWKPFIKKRPGERSKASEGHAMGNRMHNVSVFSTFLARK